MFDFLKPRVMGPPMGDVEAKAGRVRDHIKAAEPIPVLRDPLPEISAKDASANANSTDLNTLWGVILRAEGYSSLERAISRFLAYGTVRQLLAFVAETSDLGTENPDHTRNRFLLRYWGEREHDSTTDKSRDRLLAEMLVDEKDMSGFRQGAVVRRWTKLAQSAQKVNEDDRSASKVIENDIRRFLYDYGLIGLVDSLHETASNELGV